MVVVTAAPITRGNGSKCAATSRRIFAAAFGEAPPRDHGIAGARTNRQHRRTGDHLFGDLRFSPARMKRLVLLGGGHAHLFVLETSRARTAA